MALVNIDAEEAIDGAIPRATNVAVMALSTMPSIAGIPTGAIYERL